jgi:ABC-type branched-subunit amino acid transport system substrate-binding protein
VRQAQAVGLLDKADLGWIGFNEMHAKDLGGDLAAKVVTASSFVASDPTNGVPALVSRMQTHANAATPITYYAFTHYSAVAALAGAWQAAGEASGEAALRFLPKTALDAATGPISFNAVSGQATLPMVIAKGATGGGLQVLERVGTVEPGPGCEA